MRAGDERAVRRFDEPKSRRRAFVQTAKATRDDVGSATADAQPALFDKLDNDVLVMANVPFMYHRALRLTCSRWKTVVVVRPAAFETGLAEDVLVVAGGYMGQCCVYDNCSALMKVGDKARFFELPRLPRAFLAPGCGDWPPDGGVNEACAAAVNGAVYVFGGESRDPTDTVLRLRLALGTSCPRFRAYYVRVELRRHR